MLLSSLEGGVPSLNTWKRLLTITAAAADETIDHWFVPPVTMKYVAVLQLGEKGTLFNAKIEVYGQSGMRIMVGFLLYDNLVSL